MAITAIDTRGANSSIKTSYSTLWVGITWKVISCAFFAGINATARYLTGGSMPIAKATQTSITTNIQANIQVSANEATFNAIDALPSLQALPVHTIMFWQNLLGSSILLIMFLFITRKSLHQSDCILHRQPNLQQTSSWRVVLNQLLPKAHFWLHFLRITSAAIGVGLWYCSLRYLQITEVVAISFIAPTLTILGAIIFLKERLTWQRTAAFLLTTFGGLLMTRPDLKLQHTTFDMVTLLPLFAALIFAFDKLLTRKLLALNESPLSVTFVLLAFMAPISLIPCLCYPWITPTIQHWPWLLLLACLGVGAHFSFSKAYRYAEITALLPFGMSKIILCSIIGYLAFGEYPHSVELWLGIIILTGCTIIFKYHPESSRDKENSATTSH